MGRPQRCARRWRCLYGRDPLKHLSCTVATAAVSFASYKVVTFSTPDMPGVRPGQLVLARVNDTLDPYLPSAYFPLPASQPATLSLLVAADDPVSHKAAGDTLELSAPVGNGFALDSTTRRLLLVGDAGHLAALLALAQEASEKQIAVSLLVRSAGLDGRHDTPDDAALAASLSEMLPLDVEYQVAADLSAVLPVLLGWADQLCATGDATLYALLKESPGLAGRMTALEIERLGGRPYVSRATVPDSGGVRPAGFAQVIVAPLMACGFGACLGCAVETTRGVRLACVDGPVFDLAELA